jgi:hypothetical protein
LLARGCGHARRWRDHRVTNDGTGPIDEDLDVTYDLKP